MKLKLFSVIFFSSFLLACESASINGPGTTGIGDNDGGTDIDTDGSTNTDGTDIDTDGGTDNNGDADTGSTDASNGNSEAIVTGLDGVTTSSTSNGVVNSVGLIKLEPIGISADSTRGLFGKLPETSTEQEVRDWYMPPTDTCIVTLVSDNDGTEATDEFVVLDQTAILVSAGESLVLTDDNGTYATLVRTAGLSGPAYLPEADLNQGAGTNLSIDIPGDEFAAFPGIAVPPVNELNVVSPAIGENVGVSTFFQWVPNDVPGSVIELYTSGFSSVSNEAVFIGCSLVDDGLFGFSDEVQAQMGTDFDDDWTTMLRIAYNVAADDDSMVFVANSVRAK